MKDAALLQCRSVESGAKVIYFAFASGMFLCPAITEKAKHLVSC